MSDKMFDLSEVPLKELFDEINNRTKAMVIAYTIDEKEDHPIDHVRWGGPVIHALGLSHYAKTIIEKRAWGDSIPAEDDEAT